MRRLTITIAVLTLLATGSQAQDTSTATGRTPSTTDDMKALPLPDVTIPFSLSAEGRRFAPTWGLDQAWISEGNLRKGLNHMQRRNVGIGRSSFRTKQAMTDATTLNSDQVSKLRQRARIFDIVSDTLPIVLNSDNEGGVADYYSRNKQADTDHWAQMIDAHVAWMQQNTRHPVVGVSPFNEPDYSTEQGTRFNFRDIARKLKSDYPRFDTIAICGGNTLNTDQALTWYNTLQDDVDWGNTHQLAGSFDNYAALHERLAADGKTGCNDEMHNVGEAMIGLEYGMTVGIWWGFDSRARGEFCDISRHGARLGYGESRDNWTAASVWRHDESGRAKAFLGQSERQAVTTTFHFVSTDRQVFADGRGPLRELQLTMPGGDKNTYWTSKHPNAERVVDITWGDDVQPRTIDGTYKIVNKATRGLVAENGTAGSNTNISQMKDTGARQQQWVVSPVSERIGGDYSFFDIRSANDSKHLDVTDFSTLGGANVIAYPNATPSSNQQWYLEYDVDGFFFIRNRESALYLTLSSLGSSNGINIVQDTLFAQPAARSRQLWRLMPADAENEFSAPAPPTGLTAESLPAAVRLSWQANAEADCDGYTLLRAERGTGQWNTIARRLQSTTFIDNTCRQGREYVYSLKAVDRSDNQSSPCDSVVAAPTAERSLTGSWDFESSLLDATVNQMDAVHNGSPAYISQSKSGQHALQLDGTTNYVQLPYEVATGDELTVALWVNWRNATKAGQRLFDFGRDADNCVYFTPSNGRHMSLVVRQNGEEQALDGPARLDAMAWKHIVVSLSATQSAVYVDGQETMAGSTGVSLSALQPVLNYIGRSQSLDQPLLKGYVDDVRVYNYAFTADEAARLFSAATSVSNQPARPAVAVSVYSLDGRRQDGQRRGVSIVRQSDGQVRKVVR